MLTPGSRVLITGASSGIGAACCRAFAAAGCHILAVARRLERLHELAAEIRREWPVQVEVGQVDVGRRGDFAAWFDAREAPWREVDVLVNNAGLSRGLEPLQRGSLDDWDEMIDTNLKGLLYVTRAVLPGMVERQRGQVVNIGSLAGHEVYPGGSVYCATKFAVTAVGRALGIDLLGSGVRVSSVDPGMVETEFSVVRFHGDEERAAGVYRGLEPLTAADVAEAVMFCATRPPHVKVRELILMPTAQASVVHAHRTSG